VAPNCKFIVDDVESEWPYSSSKPFDFIHQRNMVGSIGDWDKLYEQGLEHLKPGGWFEIQEFEVWFRSQDGDLPEDSPIKQWQRLLNEASSQFGKRLNIAEDLKEKLANAGFEDVRDNICKVCPPLSISITRRIEQLWLPGIYQLTPNP
jgi:SAM-dependent methyltransferase